ncbi:unnamed protein product [Leptosia nina]|uniref:Uncharacterized protein n=1 Tax=Leptosia nina TaxID=320188 RepID=A0AAV1JZT1_9NEOP
MLGIDNRRQFALPSDKVKKTCLQSTFFNYRFVCSYSPRRKPINIAPPLFSSAPTLDDGDDSSGRCLPTVGITRAIGFHISPKRMDDPPADWFVERGSA